MGKRLERRFRDRPLTGDEQERDSIARQAVHSEFPPSQHGGEPSLSETGQASSLSELLKRAIRERAESVDQIAQEAGLSPELLARFLAGEHDIHMATADKLANTLGLKVHAD
jgi:DNA-binding phage protein